MKTKKMLLTLACVTGCFCLTQAPLYAGNKTPGEKLDNAIDTAKEKAHDAKVSAREKAHEAKEKAREAENVAKRKSDEARRDLAEKIRPS